MGLVVWSKSSPTGIITEERTFDDYLVLFCFLCQFVLFLKFWHLGLSSHFFYDLNRLPSIIFIHLLWLITIVWAITSHTLVETIFLFFIDCKMTVYLFELWVSTSFVLTISCLLIVLHVDLMSIVCSLQAVHYFIVLRRTLLTRENWVRLCQV